MKRLSLIFLFALLVSQSGFCSELGVDLLIWNPCLDDLDYTVVFSPELPANESTGKFKQFDCGYDPGVRVYWGAPCFACGWDLTLTYTYFHSEETSRFQFPEGIEGNLTLTHPATATDNGNDGDGRHKLDYQTVEALFGKTFCFCRDHFLTPLFGIQGVKIYRKFNASVNDTATVDNFSTYSWRSTVKALGLKIATEYAHRLCGCLDFFTRFSASLLTGDIENESHHKKSLYEEEQTNTNALLFDNGGSCYFIPAYHLKAGFKWRHCCCGQEVQAQIGYEFIDWRNLPTPKRFFGTIAGAEGDSTREVGANLGIHGLFAGLSFIF